MLAHLLTKAQFDAVFAGRLIAKSPHFALHYVALHDQLQPALAMGAVIPKRWARRAVTRNTIKRQVYAVSSTLQSSLAAGHYLVRLRSEFARAEFPSATSDALKKQVRSELLALLGKGAP